MERLELNVESRSVQGGTQVKRLRESGRVPGVVYSGGKEALAIDLDEHDFIQTVKGRPRAQLYSFKSSNSALDGLLGLIKEVQTEPLKDKILHVDFLSIEKGQSFVVRVPVKIVGEPAAVKEGRGILNQGAYELELECLAEAVPGELEIDVSGLDEGELVHAEAVPLPEGAVLKSNKDLVVVNVFSKRKLEKDAAASAESAAAPESAPAEAEAGTDGGSQDEQSGGEGS